VCFKVWEGRFESNNSNETMVRGVVATIDITCTIRVVDVGKMVKPQYEAIANLSHLWLLLHSHHIQP
jgi:hypothetical protein